MRPSKRLVQQSCGHNLSPVITATPERQLTQPRPFARSQFKSRRQQWIAERILYVVETMKSKPMPPTKNRGEEEARRFAAKGLAKKKPR